jgi:hypothetical protein
MRDASALRRVFNATKGNDATAKWLMPWSSAVTSLLPETFSQVSS